MKKRDRGFEEEPMGDEDRGPVEPDGMDMPEDLDPAEIEAAIKAGEAAAAEDLAKDANRLKDEREKLLQQLADTQEEAIEARAQADEANARYQRLQADWDNFRKRTAAERLAERERAAEGVIEALLPAVDDLERAIEHAADSEDGAVRGLAEGVEAVHAKILGVFARQGAEVIDPAGEPFDPLSAQAVGTVEDREAYADTVAEVLRKGYRMGGRIIRPAMVSVTVGGPTRPKEEG